MRLLHCKTLALRSFEDEDTPKYAILSHTWEGNEITYAMFAPIYRRWRIYPQARKVLMAAEWAHKKNLEYIWIDTCCIDKSSSSELGEAINSMYKWYRQSERCFVYLSDYDANTSTGQDLDRCRWFTRGWTLQELIAPPNLTLLDKNWTEFWFDGESGNIDMLSMASGIDRKLFLDPSRSLLNYSVAEKMSWASKRQTRREEDLAYCLLGMFGVHMPLLYGEGSNAFIRLQEAIMKESNDLSLFAWNNSTPSTNGTAGILAPDIRHFSQQAQHILSFSSYGINPEFTMTNKGLRIHTPLVADRGTDRVIMPLNCHPKWNSRRTYGIYLRNYNGVYLREAPDSLAIIPDEDDDLKRKRWEELIYIRKLY